MYYTTIISGYILGIAGSLHCIGMCGPLSLALPVSHLSDMKRFFSLLLYQVGRVLTYAALGLLTGLIGRAFYIGGIQQIISVITGSLILIFALLYFLQKSNHRIFFLQKFYTKIYSLISGILQSPKGMLSFFLLGLANGLLPCGMVYIALASALAFPEVAGSVGFMAMFGLGTLPAMIFVTYGGRMVHPRIRSGFRKATPYMMAVVGALLILRGMNLGIHFISPHLASPEVSRTVVCAP